MNLIKRIRRTWQLANKDHETVDKLMVDIDTIPDEETKAVFLGQGTVEEYEEQLKEDKGFKGIFGL